MTHSERVAQDCINHAKETWGNGWNLLSNYQKKEAVSFEILRALMTQRDQWNNDPHMALSTMKLISAVVYAVLVELENFGGDNVHNN